MDAHIPNRAALDHVDQLCHADFHPSEKSNKPIPRTGTKSQASKRDRHAAENANAHTNNHLLISAPLNRTQL
jgi:hypothetical protein